MLSLRFSILMMVCCILSTGYSQDSIARNAQLRKEYAAIKKESELLLAKVKPLGPTIIAYQSEVDSILKGMQFYKLMDERIKLIHYRDSLECGGLNINDVVAFDEVSYLNDSHLPDDRLKILQSVHRVETISPKVVLDSLPLKKENIRLESAIFLISRGIDMNATILEYFPTAKKNQPELVKDLKALSEEYNATRLRVIAFNSQLADTLSNWRKTCGGTRETCKICEHHTIQPKVYTENRDFSTDPAEFPGGNSALKQFLKEQLVYPNEAKLAGIQGKCYLKFIVCEDGSITNVQVTKGIPDCLSCDKEAIRLIYSLPLFIPAKKNKIPISSYFNVPVYFILE